MYKNVLFFKKKKKINLMNFNLKTMQDFFENIGEKKYRAKQIMQWIYKHYCTNFDDMKNLSKSCQEKLKKIAEIKIPFLKYRDISKDGTIKWGILLNSGIIEVIYIPEKNRATLCISSQIGCSLKCQFCSTGKLGFTRNLLVWEIVGQIISIIKFLKESKESFVKRLKNITNIVIMGMGEPLLNSKNIFISLEIILNDYGFGFSKNKVTLSTSGIVPALKKMIGKIDVSLAISLHAPNDTLRNTLMPINKIYNITLLMSTVQKYLKFSKANHGKVTIEYTMLHNVNDHFIHAIELINLLKNLPCKINLIPWNTFPGTFFKCSPMKKIINFSYFLKKNGFTTIIRKNRGADINAACGQLFKSI